MRIDATGIIPPNPDGLKGEFLYEWLWSVASGSIATMPQYLGKEQDANLYDYMQTMDRVALRLVKEIRTKRLLKTVRSNDLVSASGDDLIAISEMVGLPFFEDYTYESFKQRILTWAANPEGGTHGAIKRALYYYIGSGAFQQPYNILSGANIEIVSETDGTDNIVWGVDGVPDDEGVWGDSTIGSISPLWANAQAFTGEDFVVKITFDFYGMSYDRDSHQYWREDNARLQLQRIIDQVKPAGYNNTLKIIQGYTGILGEVALTSNSAVQVYDQSMSMLSDGRVKVTDNGISLLSDTQVSPLRSILLFSDARSKVTQPLSLLSDGTVKVYSQDISLLSDSRSKVLNMPMTLLSDSAVKTYSETISLLSDAKAVYLSQTLSLLSDASAKAFDREVIALSDATVKVYDQSMSLTSDAEVV